MSPHTGPHRSAPRRSGPLRRLRRWARHTPNATIALNLVALGLALILIAGIVALTLL